MSEESKPREPSNHDLFGPPFFGVGLGEKLGALDARSIRVEKDVAELKSDLRNLGAKVDEIAHALGRHDERFANLEKSLDNLEKRLDNLEKRLDNNAKLMVGLFTALFVAIIVQKIL